MRCRVRFLRLVSTIQRFWHLFLCFFLRKFSQFFSLTKRLNAYCVIQFKNWVRSSNPVQCFPSRLVLLAWSCYYFLVLSWIHPKQCSISSHIDVVSSFYLIVYRQFCSFHSERGFLCSQTKLFFLQMRDLLDARGLQMFFFHFLAVLKVRSRKFYWHKSI